MSFERITGRISWCHSAPWSRLTNREYLHPPMSWSPDGQLLAYKGAAELPGASSSASPRTQFERC
jgi:hypothetical protein